MRHERQIMLQELQNQSMDSLDYPLYIPNISLKFVPIYNMPSMNTDNNNRNNNHDSMSELIKLFLIKQLFDDNGQNNQKNRSYPPQ